jgi:lysophospholipase L1-like esterase
MKHVFWLAWLALFLAGSERGAWAAEPILHFSQWEKEVAAFERADATNPPPKGAWLFVGSSTIHRWNSLASDFPGQPVINRGLNGTEIVDCTHFAGWIIFPYSPKVIFFRAGGNDLWDGKSPKQVFADFKAFVRAVHAKLPQADLVFISWSPTPARWKQAAQEKTLNKLVAAYLRGRPHLFYIETYPLVLGANGQPRPELFAADKLHFNAGGYKLLAERVRAGWKEICLHENALRPQPGTSRQRAISR